MGLNVLFLLWIKSSLTWTQFPQILINPKWQLPPGVLGSIVLKEGTGVTPSFQSWCIHPLRKVQGISSLRFRKDKKTASISTSKLCITWIPSQIIPILPSACAFQLRSGLNKYNIHTQSRILVFRIQVVEGLEDGTVVYWPTVFHCLLCRQRSGKQWSRSQKTREESQEGTGAGWQQRDTAQLWVPHSRTTTTKKHSFFPTSLFLSTPKARYLGRDPSPTKVTDDFTPQKPVTWKLEHCQESPASKSSSDPEMTKTAKEISCPWMAAWRFGETYRRNWGAKSFLLDRVLIELFLPLEAKRDMRKN